MARLRRLDMELKTGTCPLQGPLRYYINGFDVEFDEMEGSTAPGGTLQAVGYPESHPHTLTLGGPETGTWDLEGLRITCHYEDQEPYTVRLGSVTLHEGEELNLLVTRPLPVIEV